MKRIILLVTVAAMMAVMMVASAAPALALPEDFPPGEGPSVNAFEGLSTAVANVTKPKPKPPPRPPKDDSSDYLVVTLADASVTRT